MRWSGLELVTARVPWADERPWRMLFEAAPVALIVQRRGALLFANAEAVRLFGFADVETLCRRPGPLFVHPDDRRLAEERMSRAFRGERLPAVELRLLRADESGFTGACRAVRVVLGDGPALLIGVVDISERKRLEERLRASEERFRDFAELASDWFWEMGPDLRFTWVSERAAEISGVPTAARIGRGREELAGEGTDPEALEAHLRCLRAHKPFREFEYERVIGRDRRWISVSGKPLFDRAGRFLGYRGTGRDITARKRAQIALEQSERRYRQLVELSPDGIIVHRHGVIRFANRRMAEMFGVGDPEALVGRPVREFLTAEGRRQVEARWRRLERGEPVGRLELELVRPDGSRLPIESRVAAIEEPDGPALLAIARDISGSRRQQRALAESEERYRLLVEMSPDGIFLHEGGRILFANRRAAAMLGLDEGEGLAGRSVFDFVDPVDHAKIRPRIARLERGEAVPPLELRARRFDGGSIVIEARAAPVRYQGRTAAMVVIRDVTERHRTEERLRYLAHFDPLTGLPNRNLFTDRLDRALALARREGRRVGLLLLDLDGFKDINDTFGHHAGDELLFAVAERLGGVVRESDTLARLGGDEFAILLSALDAPEEAERVAERVLHALDERLTVQGRGLRIGLSIGIAIGPGDGETVEQLLASADLALFAAKEQGRGRALFFDPALRERSNRRLWLETQLREHLAEGRLVVHYQPVLRLRDGAVVGAEALLRWPGGGPDAVRPDVFVALAEDCGLAGRLTEAVLRRARADCESWPRGFAADFRLAVNLSPRELAKEGAARQLLARIRRTGLDPHALVVEVTERLFLEDGERVRAELEELRGAGVRVAIDDFGTGYASLGYLKRMPVDILKLDKSFVAGLPDDRGDVAIVKAVAILAKSLGVELLAEGVERAEQLEALRALGFDCGQGYLFAPPMDADALARWLDPDRAPRPVRKAAGHGTGSARPRPAGKAQADRTRP